MASATRRHRKLDGIELAPFWRRALAFVFDWMLVSLLTLALAAGGVLGYLKLREMHGHPMPAHIHFDLRPEEFRIDSSDTELSDRVNNRWTHILLDIAVPVLYFGLLTWRGDGRSPGKHLLRIRVVPSSTHT